MRLPRAGRGRRWVQRHLSCSSALAASVQERSVLRPYQASVIQRAVDLYGRGTRRLLVPLATGLGKTVVFTHLPQAFPELCRRGTLVLVHRDELVQQAVSSFGKFLPHLSVGVEKGAQTAHPGLDVVVASVQTLGRRGSGPARLRKYAAYGGIVVVDEAHHVKAGGMYDNVLNGLGVGSACRGHTRDDRLLAGFTATPRRADGLSLRPFFDYSIGGLDLEWGISNGYLVDIHAYSVKTATDIDAVPIRLQDFSSSALSNVVNNDIRNEAAARAMLEFGAGAAGAGGGGGTTSRGIAFCADVRHAHDLARVLNDHGVSALALDGKMSKKERHRVLSAFRSGEASTLTNCGVLTEGFDAPFCDTIIMCRPTQSAPLYMQMMGRGTRPFLPSAVTPLTDEMSDRAPPTSSAAVLRKTAIQGSPKPRMHVIDLVDNCGKHKVMGVSTALGLSPEFRGDGDEGAFSVEHVSSLLAEALSLTGATDGDIDTDEEQSPIMNAKTPRELALLVKHYRLLQGAKAAGMLLIGSTPGSDDTAGLSVEARRQWDLAGLSVGDRIGKDTFLRVTVEAINIGEDEDTDEESDQNGAYEEEDWYEEEEHDSDVEDHTSISSLSRRVGSRGTGAGGGVARGFGKPQRRTKRHLSRRTRKKSPSAAVVSMRHPASGVLFVWRTAGVKDTSGGELHEGGMYRLVASVKEPPNVTAREIGVTRCRLSLVTGFRR